MFLKLVWLVLVLDSIDRSASNATVSRFKPGRSLVCSPFNHFFAPRVELDAVIAKGARSSVVTAVFHHARCELGLCVQMMTGSYQSRKFKELKGADAVFKADREARDRMRANADPAAFRQALRRLLPWPCSRRYTIVTTVQATVLHSLVAVASQCAPWLVGALMLGALWVWHGRRIAK